MSKKSDSELLAQRALQVQRGAARAAVLGVNDGLVSVLCLALTVAGAGAPGHTVFLAGFGGLIAGAFSMSAGEWISVRSQVDLFRGILSDLRKLIRRDRDLLIEQLADNLAEGGQSAATAKKAASEIGKKDATLESAYATQVMGINPDELGSPWVAAISSFALFTIGALAPLLPWAFLDGFAAVSLSIGLTAIGSLVVGAYIGRSSGTSIVGAALRQLLIVVLASAVTYGIGIAFGGIVN